MLSRSAFSDYLISYFYQAPNQRFPSRNGYESIDGDENSTKVVQIVAPSFLSQIIPVLFLTFVNLLEVVAIGVIFLPKEVGDSVAQMTQLLFLTTAISQFTFAFTSEFDAVIGTEMADNIPFLQTMSLGIATALNEDSEKIMPTILIGISLSTILNGCCFMLVGYLKIGKILHICPRYVFLGMGVGFGMFVIQQSFEIASGSQMIPSTFENMTTDMWTQLLLGVLAELSLRFMQSLHLGEITLSIGMLVIPTIFYIYMSLVGMTFDQGREQLWLFPTPGKAMKWWDTWSQHDLSLVDWNVLSSQFGAIAALAVYSLVVIPLRIPALALLSEEDVSFDGELRSIGLGNVLAGIVGCPHNLLAYGNSAMFYELKGKGKYAKLGVAILTLGLFFVGPSLIEFIPRVVATVIMLHLGVDLLITNLYKSSKSLDRLEYICVVVLGGVVAIYGFVVGMVVGFLLACATHVLESALVPTIHTVYSGIDVRSNANWPSLTRKKLDEAIVEKKVEIAVIQLQGHLFFGNVESVIDRITDIIEKAELYRNSTQFQFTNLNDALNSRIKGNTISTFIVLDFSFVSGADINAVGSFCKMKRRMHDKAIIVFTSVESSIMTTFSIESGLKQVQNQSQYSRIDSLSIQGPTLNTPSVIANFYPTVYEALEVIEENIIENIIHMHIEVSSPGGRIDSKSDATKLNRLDLSFPPMRRASSIFANRGLVESIPHEAESMHLRKIIDILFEFGAGHWHVSDGPAIQRLAAGLAKNVKNLIRDEFLWINGSDSVEMVLLLQGKLHSKNTRGGSSKIKPGAFVGLLPFMCMDKNYNTVIAGEPSTVAVFTRDDLNAVEETDKPVYSLLQKITLLLMASKKNNLLLFDAGSTPKQHE